ncbi:MAG: selenocysteine-specific translation elongation factor [Dehalococcoidia bacterium]
MYIVGTAGHVDHGKSVLIHALTGIDPDRLPEEKSRGLTLDLGFAWLTLSSGKEVGIIDVPGHEKFVRNMVAGAGGVDLALLVIAANEGVMPQTKEHLAVLDLLNVKGGIVVITKKDLVDEEMLELVKLEAQEVVGHTVLDQAPVMAVSAMNREGLSELTDAIDHLLDEMPSRKDIGRPRLAIDRAFTIKGSGTVVTGTLIDGTLSLRQEVEVLPPGMRLYIRGLQTHKRSIETAVPGSRVAVNLGGVSKQDIERGMVITTPGWLKPTQLVDVKVRATADLHFPMKHNMTVSFHAGASETTGKMRLLDKEKIEAGDSGLAQVKVTNPIVVAKGDPFIVRSSVGTLGGGEIIDAHPKRHRRFQSNVLESLRAREEGSPEGVLLATLEAQGSLEFEKLVLESYLGKVEAEEAIRSLTQEDQLRVVGLQGPDQLIFSRDQWNATIQKVTNLVSSYHSRFPLRRGMPKEELRSQLRFSTQHFEKLLKGLTGEGFVAEEGTVVKLPSHTFNLSQEQEERANAFLKALDENPYSPPTDFPIEDELVNVLLEQGKVVRVGGGVVFSASAYKKMLEHIVEHIKGNGKISVAEVRNLFRTSRKYALPLLEYMDDQKITRRVGDERVLRK